MTPLSRLWRVLAEFKMCPHCCSYLLSHSRQREEILHSLTLPKPMKRVWRRNHGNEVYKNTDHTIAIQGCRNKSQFTADSKLRCEECNADVHVGTSGMSNLNVHRDSKTCRENKTTNTLPPQKKEKSLLTFFSQKTIQQNTPQVASPPKTHHARMFLSSVRIAPQSHWQFGHTASMLTFATATA